MGGIAELFCEEIAGVDDTRYVFYTDDTRLVGFTHTILVKVYVLCAFECHGGSPVDGSFVVVIDGDGGCGIWETEVHSAMLDR
jgi:hypothetical protein